MLVATMAEKDPIQINYDQYLQRHLAYLEEWRVGVLQQESAVQAANKGAIEFAQLGIRVGLILNGGALIALPALLTLIPDVNPISLAYPHLIGAASAFILGLATAALSVFCAFVCMRHMSDYHNHR